jgi:hypothetical protein
MFEKPFGKALNIMPGVGRTGNAVAFVSFIRQSGVPLCAEGSACLPGLLRLRQCSLMRPNSFVGAAFVAVHCGRRRRSRR